MSNWQLKYHRDHYYNFVGGCGLVLSVCFFQAYGSEFIRKVHYRHVLAKSYFSRIPEMAGHMGGKVKELPLPRPKEREILIPTHNTLVDSN